MREDLLSPQVVAVCTSGGGIPKLARPFVEVNSAGLKGDGHNHAKHNTPMQAVCLQDIEALEELSAEGFTLSCGTTGENLTIRHGRVNQLPVGTILEFEGGVVLELTKIRKPCYVLDAIDPRLKEVIIDRCGIYARVVQEGIIKAGESFQIKEMTALSPLHI